MKVPEHRLYIEIKNNRPYAEMVKITNGKYVKGTGYEYKLPNKKHYKYIGESKDQVYMQCKYLKKFRIENKIKLSDIYYHRPIGEIDKFYFHEETNTFFKRTTDAIKRKLPDNAVLVQFILDTGYKSKLKILSKEVSLVDIIEKEKHLEEQRLIKKKKSDRLKLRSINNIINEYIRIY